MEDDIMPARTVGLGLLALCLAAFAIFAIGDALRGSPQLPPAGTATSCMEIHSDGELCGAILGGIQ